MGEAEQGTVEGEAGEHLLAARTHHSFLSLAAAEPICWPRAPTPAGRDAGKRCSTAAGGEVRSVGRRQTGQPEERLDHSVGDRQVSRRRG